MRSNPNGGDADIYKTAVQNWEIVIGGSCGRRMGRKKTTSWIIE
jgi:hypothetical protein